MGLIDELEMIGFEADGPKSCEMRGEKRDNMESQSGEQNKRGSWFFAYPPCDVILFSVPFHRCSGTILFCLASESLYGVLRTALRKVDRVSTNSTGGPRPGRSGLLS